MNNDVGYYGLAKYQPDLILDSYLHSVQYSIDENLRETPILKDTSIIPPIYTQEFCCNYFSPIEGRPLQLTLSLIEYRQYCYIRDNAFYTPYGMMVLLSDLLSCTNSFILANDLLIPKNRKIYFVDIATQRSLTTNDINSGHIFCAFFADYVIEHIFLSKIYKTLRDTTLCNIRMKSNPCPVIMRNHMIPNIGRYPVYDIQLKDIMVFRNRLDYDMYMMALEQFFYYNEKVTKKYLFARVINNIIFCDIKDPRYDIFHKGKKRRV